MKVDIYDIKIDINKLINKVREFEICTNQDAYIIMNEKTCTNLALSSIRESFSMLNPDMTNKDYVAKFRGNTVLIDPELADGEVEIR